jgi:hypothetical protein
VGLAGFDVQGIARLIGFAFVDEIAVHYIKNFGDSGVDMGGDRRTRAHRQV